MEGESVCFAHSGVIEKIETHDRLLIEHDKKINCLQLQTSGLITKIAVAQTVILIAAQHYIK